MPYTFDEFFASGREETISPFLTRESRKWGKHLSLRLAIGASVFLLGAWASSFFSLPLAHLLLIVVYFLAGTPALIGALEKIRTVEINIDVLMVLAAFLSVTIGSGMEGGLLLVLFELAAAIEHVTLQKTKSTLIHLLRLSPKKGVVIGSDGGVHEKAVQEITVGMHLLIKAGETIPLDGEVIAGSSFVNLAHLTGESISIPKNIGDTVEAGARTIDGTLTLRVSRASGDSTLAQIIHLMTKAQSAKPKLERFLDRFGKKYALTVMGLSLLLALALPSLFSLPFQGVNGSIYRAVSFLITASPCALILSTPTAYLSALSACAKRGILLKGGMLFDGLSHCRQIAFDKTGTLTTGDLSVQKIIPLIPSNSIDEDKALMIAASLEHRAVHPIAHALCQAAKERELSPAELTHFTSIPGSGLSAHFDGSPVYIGRPEWIQEHLTAQQREKWPAIKELLDQEHEMFTLLLTKEALFAFTFQDEIRPGIAQMITLLQKEGLTPIMLTGDHKKNAEAVASSTSIAKVYSELKPQDKLALVEKLSKQQGLAMVGEGINDAPALARATVGIALGAIGSATAIDAADIVFLHDEITLLPFLLKKAKWTLQIVRQNISLSIALILLSSIPATLGMIPLWAAVLLHEGGTVLVGLNSLRLFKGK